MFPFSREKKVSLFWQTLKRTSSGAFLSVDVCYNLPTPLSRDLQLLGIGSIFLFTKYWNCHWYTSKIYPNHWGPVSKMLPVREAILVNLATSLQFLLGEEVTLCLCIYSCKQFYLMMNMGMDLIQWQKRFCCIVLNQIWPNHSFWKVVARMSGEDGLLLSDEQLWAAFRDAQKCFQVNLSQMLETLN